MFYAIAITWGWFQRISYKRIKIKQLFIYLLRLQVVTALSCGCLHMQKGMASKERRSNYRCDITYTNNSVSQSWFSCCSLMNVARSPFIFSQHVVATWIFCFIVPVELAGDWGPSFQDFIFFLMIIVILNALRNLVLIIYEITLRETVNNLWWDGIYQEIIQSSFLRDHCVFFFNWTIPFNCAYTGQSHFILQ